MRRVDDLNESDDERIGYTMATIKNGQRVSSAHAFLHPVEQRPNLTVAVDSLATNLLFDGEAVVGVRVRTGHRLHGVPSAGSDPRAGQHPDAAAAATLGHRARRRAASRRGSTFASIRRTSARVCASTGASRSSSG